MVIYSSSEGKGKNMDRIMKRLAGICVCLLIGIPAWMIGNQFPIIGGPILAILFGMTVALFIKDKRAIQEGVQFVSKKVLQYAVILLGFGLNLGVVFETGAQSLPIIIATITVSLFLAYVMQKTMKIPEKIATLIGVGSSICGGSAIAAAAPVIGADDEEVAQAISVIFFFNVIAAVVFPWLGTWLGFSTTSADAFGIFAGTAVNDTSSVTAAASTWDSMYNLGSTTLDKAVTVKLVRTLAIIPITFCLALRRAKKEKNSAKKVSIKKIFPFFILYFILASLFTTISFHMGANMSLFTPLKTLSKFFIVLAMAAIGLNTNIVHLVKSGGKPIVMGFVCWLGITSTALLLQFLLGIW